MKRVITLTLALSLLLAGSAMAQGRWGQNTTPATSGSNQNGYCTQTIADMPLEDVSANEKADLLYMREEEKLAKDLYQSFYEKWGTRIFDNIVKSEQKHTDSIKALLTKYAITDPVINDMRGVFTNTDLQQIYNDLLTSGSLSFLDALKVGAAVEELDISDLEKAIAEADSQDIKTVYQNLMKGSQNHLRSYVRMLEAYGQEYQAVYLTSEEVAAIIDSPMERGLYDKNGTPMFQ
jgi:hypothetical protein